MRVSFPHRTRNSCHDTRTARGFRLDKRESYGLLRPGGGLRRFRGPRDRWWERKILVGAYRLTVGSGVVGALIRAKERGVDVRADREAPCGRASGIDPLTAAGVSVWIDDRARIAHAKMMVMDDAVILTGS